MPLDQELSGADRDAILLALGIPLDLVRAAENGELAALRQSKQASNLRLETAVSQYIQASPNISDSSNKTYAAVLDGFVAYMHCQWRGTPDESWTIDRVMPRDVSGFVMRPKRDGSQRDARTANRDLAIVRALFWWLVDREEMTENPFRRIRRQHESRLAPVAFTLEEQQLVLNMARQTANGIRNHTIIHLALNTGLRASEICQLTWPHVNLEGGWLTVQDGKGQKTRTVPLLPSLADGLRYYWDAFRSRQTSAPGCSQYVFVNDSGARWGHPMTVDGLEDMIGRLVTKLGRPKGQNCHVLRHSFAVNLLRRGVHLVYIRQLLGHESLETTRTYLRLGDPEVAREMSLIFPEGVLVPEAQREILDHEFQTLVDEIYRG